MDDKNTKFLIIGGACVTLAMVLGLAYFFATICSQTSPQPTPVLSASASAHPSVMSTASSTPWVTPSSTPVYTASPSSTPVPPMSMSMATATPTSTPMPTMDPYLQSGWPYYSMPYQSGSEPTKGTITVHIQDLEGGPIYSGEAGVLPGSGAPSQFFADPEIAVPTSWTSIGADGSARLGEFEDGTYTVYYRHNGYYYLTSTVVIEDSHRNWDVNFVLQQI